jgi:hypothetical protein
MEHIIFWSMLMMLIHLDENINTIQKNTETLVEIGLVVNAGEKGICRTKS